jgi:hypothetical protein
MSENTFDRCGNLQTDIKTVQNLLYNIGDLKESRDLTEGKIIFRKLLREWKIEAQTKSWGLENHGMGCSRLA